MYDLVRSCSNDVYKIEKSKKKDTLEVTQPQFSITSEEVLADQKQLTLLLLKAV